MRKLATVATVLLLAGCGTSPAPSASCGQKATKSCTPLVGPTGSVEVDTLTWHVRKVFTTQVIPDLPIAATKTAPEGDTFLVAYLKVTNGKTEPVTPTRELVRLVGRHEVKQLVNYETAWETRPLTPNSPAELTAMFEVPQSETTRHPALRFNELGFGQTHAFIALPRSITGRPETSVTQEATATESAEAAAGETAPRSSAGLAGGAQANNCGGELFGNSNASCAFAREVLRAVQRRYAVLHAPPARISAYSPVTHQLYDLTCVITAGAGYVECATKTAVVTFPMSRAAASSQGCTGGRPAGNASLKPTLEAAANSAHTIGYSTSQGACLTNIKAKANGPRRNGRASSQQLFCLEGRTASGTR